MANNTEVIFEDIEQRIIKEINDAHYAIFVSVAWFTNKKLFNALLEKAKQNCYVSIIIQLDEINSQCGIDYSQIQVGRSECFEISKDAELLHDKFCVIDFKKVITGSYNWTYKASHNSENIIILDDPSVATQYICRFEQQKAKFQGSSISQSLDTSSISNTILNTTESFSTIQQNTIETTKPDSKQCNYCKANIGHNDVFCKYCGERQKEWKSQKTKGVSYEVTCKKCLRKQNEALTNAFTKFCTYCGSNELEWTWN